MDHQRDVELAKSYRLLNHGPVTLVTFEHEGAGNVMAAAWVMPGDFDPPKLLLVLDSNTYSRDLLEASGTFVINLPCRRQAELTLAVGNSTGREQDKFPSTVSPRSGPGWCRHRSCPAVWLTLNAG